MGRRKRRRGVCATSQNKRDGRRYFVGLQLRFVFMCEKNSQKVLIAYTVEEKVIASKEYFVSSSILNFLRYIGRNLITIRACYIC